MAQSKPQSKLCHFKIWALVDLHQALQIDGEKTLKQMNDGSSILGKDDFIPLLHAEGANQWKLEILRLVNGYKIGSYGILEPTEYPVFSKGVAISEQWVKYEDRYVTLAAEFKERIPYNAQECPRYVLTAIEKDNSQIRELLRFSSANEQIGENYWLEKNLMPQWRGSKSGFRAITAVGPEDWQLQESPVFYDLYDSSVILDELLKGMSQQEVSKIKF